MPGRKKDPDAALKQTSEFIAFEEATKRILKVPKKEIDKKLAEERAQKKTP